MFCLLKGTAAKAAGKTFSSEATQPRRLHA